MFNALIISPQKVLFEGQCNSIIVPGEQGFFEILSYHKDCMSRLLRGPIVVDGEKNFHITRGIIKMERNRAVLIVEEPRVHR